MTVVINGTEYVPKGEVKPITDDTVREAAYHLLHAFYLYGTPKYRGHVNMVFDTLRELLGRKMLEDLNYDPEKLLDRIKPGWRDD